MGDVCARYGGTGGGHASVARVKCAGEVDDVLGYIVRRIGEYLGLEVKQVS